MDLNEKQREVYQLLVKDTLEEGSKTLLLGSAGTGKALKNTELVLTNKGFVPIRHLTMDHLVYSEDGKPHKLLGVYPQGMEDIYKVTFKDNTYSLCSLYHIWRVKKVKKSKSIFVNMNVKDLLRKGYIQEKYNPRYNSYRNEYKYAIPIAAPVEFPKQDFPIDPYALGVLLGDDSFKVKPSCRLSITSKVDLGKVKEGLPEGLTFSKVRNVKGNCYDITLTQEKKFLRNPLFTILRKTSLLDKYSYKRHIPKKYLIGSIFQRKELLRGLLSTDRYAKKNNVSEYSTTSKQLAKEVAILMRSLGLYVKIQTKTLKDNKNRYKKIYKVRQLASTTKSIVSIEKVGREECTCISIDSPTQTFLTNDFNVTHNTTVVSQIAKDFKGSVLLTATTNKAKENLSKATGLKAYTTHSALGFVMTRNGMEEYLADINEPKVSDLLIVDEVSMLPNAVYQKIIRTPYKHILFVGDGCQLPAIGLKASIQADKQITLTEQMRQQSKDGSLEKYFDTLRYSILQNTMPDYRKDLPSDIILYEDHKEFCKAYLSCPDGHSKRILAYSNKVVDCYNSNIKQGDKFTIGDLLIIDKPLGEAKNGDLVEVVQVIEQFERYVLQVVFKEHLYSIFVYKTKTTEKAVLATHFDDSSQYWAVKDKIYHPKHIYASTVHKAQGQSIDEVFIDATDILQQLKRKPTRFNNYNKPISKQEFLRLMYVAISRMGLKAHLFVGTTRKYKSLKEN